MPSSSWANDALGELFVSHHICVGSVFRPNLIEHSHVPWHNDGVRKDGAIRKAIKYLAKQEEGKPIMSVDILKSASINHKNHTLSMSIGNSSLAPRHYYHADMLADDEAGLRENLFQLGLSLCGCDLRILPSANCLLHDAYVRTIEALGTDMAVGRVRKVGCDSVTYEDFASRFADEAMTGKHDTTRYMLVKSTSRYPVRARAMTDGKGIIRSVWYSLDDSATYSYATAMRLAQASYGAFDVVPA